MLEFDFDSSPLLAAGSVLALLKYCLWGRLAVHGVSSWVLSAQRQLGNSQPVFHNLYSCSASRGPGAQSGGRCPVCVCGAAPALWTPCAVWDGGFGSSTYIQSLCWWDFFVSSTFEINIFQYLCVLNSNLSYRLLITVLKYSIFKWGFSCKDYVSVISGNKQGAGRRLFFPIIFWHQCEKLTALVKPGICTSQSSCFPCWSVLQTHCICWFKAPAQLL